MNTGLKVVITLFDYESVHEGIRVILLPLTVERRLGLVRDFGVQDFFSFSLLLNVGQVRDFWFQDFESVYEGIRVILLQSTVERRLVPSFFINTCAEPVVYNFIPLVSLRRLDIFYGHHTLIFASHCSLGFKQVTCLSYFPDLVLRHG